MADLNHATGGIIRANDGTLIALLGESGCDYGTRSSMHAQVDAGNAYIRDQNGNTKPLNALLSVAGVELAGTHTDTDDDGTATI